MTFTKNVKTICYIANIEFCCFRQHMHPLSIKLPSNKPPSPLEMTKINKPPPGA